MPGRDDRRLWGTLRGPGERCDGLRYQLRPVRDGGGIWSDVPERGVQVSNGDGCCLRRALRGPIERCDGLRPELHRLRDGRWDGGDVYERRVRLPRDAGGVRRAVRGQDN